MKYFILMALVVFSSSVLAEKPYGMAGCGLGNMILEKDGNQILAATTNGTGTQTFGISSGTSNCVTATERTAQIRNFIEANYESLVTDMAKGQGDSLKTLSGMYGCKNDTFATEIQKNYETITPKTENAVHVMANINTVIEDSEALRSNCTNVI